MIETNQPAIELLSRRTGTPPPEPDPHIRVSAELGWFLRGSPDALDSAEAALIGVSERISENILLLTFGNAVGFFDVPGLGLIEVMSGKWSRDSFDQMLSELTDVAAGLPFAASSSAALPYDRSVVAQENVLYHMFVYIRHALSDAPTNQSRLTQSLRDVLRDPYRRFERTRRDVPIDQVRQLDAATLSSLAAGRGGFTRIPGRQTPYANLAHSLNGHLPERVDERHTLSTVNTPENRFVKAFLASMSGVFDSMRDVAGNMGGSAFTRRIVQECDQLDTLLRPIAQHPLWNEVGPMTHLPASSPVLHRRRGYRDVYGHFAKMRLAARVPLDTTLVRDLLEAKDIAQLYEIWSFFVVVRQISSMLDPPVRAGSPHVDSLQVTVQWDLECVWRDGTRLLYNPQFSRSRKHQHSFSVPLRPDIALEVQHGPNAGLHLFDAKFKLDKLGDIMPISDDLSDQRADEEEERRGTFKRGDLYKMHAYRDAIPASRSVWILYPGTETRFFSTDGATSPYSLPETLDGVGAIPLRPGTHFHSALNKVLSYLLDNQPGDSNLTNTLETNGLVGPHHAQ